MKTVVFLISQLSQFPGADHVEITPGTNPYTVRVISHDNTHEPVMIHLRDEPPKAKKK